MASIQQDILRDAYNGQAATHIRECRGDLNRYTPCSEELGRHVVRAAPKVSHTTTIREVPTKLNSGICSRDEVLAPSNARPGHHSGLPHSPSNKLPQSRERRFDKVVTGILGLSVPINPTSG
jgi:hypothetical protein